MYLPTAYKKEAIAKNFVKKGSDLFESKQGVRVIDDDNYYWIKGSMAYTKVTFI